jgi:hypothetical protein
MFQGTHAFNDNALRPICISMSAMKSSSIRSLTLPLAAAVLFFTGCSKNSPHTPDNSQYSSAINTYWSAHPVCLWSSSVRFPTEQDVNKLDNTQGYDALTDLGYLQRIQATKKTFIFGQKQVSDYDLTAQGRTAWVADPNQPGYGNFCFGHRTVTSVDSVATAPNTSGSGPNPASATVNYHYAINDAAAWAKNAEIQTAFPGVATVLSGPQTDVATLTNTSSGWQMTAPAQTSQSPGPMGPKSNDYGVVGSY